MRYKFLLCYRKWPASDDVVQDRTPGSSLRIRLQVNMHVRFDLCYVFLCSEIPVTSQFPAEMASQNVKVIHSFRINSKSVYPENLIHTSSIRRNYSTAVSNKSLKILYFTSY
jgi:hypothetical protein